MVIAVASRSTNRPMTPADDPTAERIRLNLVRFREEAGLSQQAAADAVGLGVDMIRKMESGTRGVSAFQLKRFADTYGHLVDHFFLEEPPPHDPALMPAFALKTLSKNVDADLLKSAEEFLAKLNREHLERVRAIKQQKR